MPDTAPAVPTAAKAPPATSQIKRGWKSYLGIALFVYSFAPYLVTPFVLPLFPLTSAEMVTIATGHVISGELAFLASVALLGKPFIQYLKQRLRAFFRRKGPPPVHKPVSRFRHYFGIALLLISCIVPYYVAEVSIMTGFVEKHGHAVFLTLLLGGDALFVASLFVLGADFWRRLMELFRWPGNDSPQPEADHGAAT